MYAGDNLTVPTAPTCGRPASGWAWWPLRVLSGIQALLLIGQPILAGAFLDGHYTMLQTHSVDAVYAFLTQLLVICCALLLRWPGHGPAWPIGLSALLLVMIGVQMILGYARALVVHIPLGVAIVAIAVWFGLRTCRGDKVAP